MPESKRQLSLTEDQIRQLYWDTYAYHSAAKSLSKEAKLRNLALASPQEISLNSAATVNLGFSLELLMKYFYALSKENYPSGARGHNLSNLYQKMPDDPKAEMSSAYEQFSQENVNPHIFRATKWSCELPEDPPAFDVVTLESFFAYLDQIGAYGKRYGFETYSPQEWIIRVDVEWLAGLIEEFVNVANNFHERHRSS